MPRYTIKKGYESREFSQEGVRRISDTEIESDHELSSPLLTPVEAQSAPVQPAAPVAAAPVAPATPAPAQPVAPPAPQAETLNTESENQA